MPGVLSGLLILPLIGAALILFVRGEDEAALSNIRYWALFTTLVTFALSLVAWWQFDPANSSFQLVEQASWIPTLGVKYHFGIDGISLVLILLTTLIVLAPGCL